MFTPLAPLLSVAALLAAQPPADSSRGAIVGVVYDSVARAPLAEADVQVARADGVASGRVYAARTDREGRYRVDGVPAGAYVAGFFHPRLDSLGIAVDPVRVDVAPNGVTRATLALPSATAVQRQLCAAGAISDTTGLVVGFVRDARSLRPRDAAVVRVEWRELSVGRGGVTAEVRGGAVAVRPSGWFAACGVPAGRLVTLSAAAGADTSGGVAIDVTGRSAAPSRTATCSSAPAPLGSAASCGA